DTIQLERTVSAPPGWRIRAGKLGSATVAEPLGDAVVLAAPNAWVVRYVVVAWTPGDISLDMPPIWRLGPDGTADSLPGGPAALPRPPASRSVQPVPTDCRGPLVEWRVAAPHAVETARAAEYRRRYRPDGRCRGC